MVMHISGRDTNKTQKSSGICGITAGTIGMVLGLAAPPASAQNTLERMQDDVASIVERAKGAVVSIEDARGIVLHYDKTTLNKQNLEGKRKLLSLETKLAAAQFDTVDTKYQQGASSYAELLTVRMELARAKLELAIAERKLKDAGKVSEQDSALSGLLDELLLRQIMRQLERDAAFAKVMRDKEYMTEVSPRIKADRAELAQSSALLKEAEGNYAKAQKAIQKQKTETKTVDPFNQLAWKSGSQLSYQSPGVFATPSPKSGTGFSIGSGYILTTADVLEGMQNPIVTTDTGLRIQGRVVGIDSELNVGLIVLEAKVDLPALTLGSSASAVPGHFAISIGNQSGQHNSVALAMVAGVRSEGTYTGSHFYPVLLQLAGTIGAGSSGSPILDARGEVIGILAAAQADASPTYFATHPDTGFVPGKSYTYSVKSVVSKQVIQTNVPVLSKVPIVSELFRNSPKADPTRDVKNKPSGKDKTPAMKTKSVPDGQKSDGTTGDTPPVVKPDTQQVQVLLLTPTKSESTLPFTTNLGTTDSLAKPDVSANLGYAFNTGGNVPRPSVTSAGFAIAVDQIKSVIETLKAGKPIAHNWMGIGLDNKEDAKEMDGIVKIDRTVQINSVYAGSPADRAGIRQGDVLVSIDSRTVHSSEEVRSLVLQLRKGAQVPIVFLRKGETRTGTLLIVPRPEKLPGLLTPTR